MRAKVLFFGMLKDVVGRAEEEVELAPETTLRGVFEQYSGRYPRLRDLSGSIVMARNREFANPSATVEDGDEIAFLPPVSGGCGESGGLGGAGYEVAEGGHYFALTHSPIDSRRVIQRILTGAEGAVVTFEGTVRNHTGGRRTLYLDYECYEPMAIKVLAETGQAIARSFEVERIAIVHRLGRMLIGETSVAVIVTAQHRRAAFEAAMEGIGRVKKRVPIWKKEHFADGEVWVEGEWDHDVPKAPL